MVRPETHAANQLFTEKYKNDIGDLLRFEGIDPAPQADIVALTMPWMKGDHFKPDHPIKTDPKNVPRIEQLFRNMGFVDEVLPLGSEYDRVVVLGGVHASNQLRFDFLHRLIEGHGALSEKGKVIVLGGNRPLNPDEIADDTKLKTETDSLRLAAKSIIGDFALSQLHFRLGLMPQSYDVLSRYVGNIGNIPLDFVNGNPVEREHGEPRPTTRSTILEWLAYDSIPVGSRVLFITGNPYIPRTAIEIARIMAEHPLQISTEVCGPAAIKRDTLIQRCYGELARILYIESKIRP